MRKALGAVIAAPFLAGATLLGYGLTHAHSYRLRRRSVLLPHPDRDGAAPLRILHISDPHLLATQRKRTRFLTDLAQTDPDFVVVTGDLISEPEAIEPLLRALEPLLHIPGAFVFGSNDYYAPEFRNPLRYLWTSSAPADTDDPPRKPQTLPTRDLARGLAKHGWMDLTNTRGHVSIKGWDINLVGVDDPHVERDEFPMPTPSIGQVPYQLRLGLTHAPYSRVLDAMLDDGCHIVFAGHTHGGQVRLPGKALVTNCDIPAEYVSGMFRWPIGSHTPDDPDLPIEGDGAIVGWDCEETTPATTIVQTSAGVGTSPFAPVRTFCPPEAIQVDILPM